MLDNLILTCLLAVVWISVLAKTSMVFDFAYDMPNEIRMVLVSIAIIGFVLLPILILIRIWR